MPTTRVNFRLPEALVRRTDVVAEVTGETRTAVVAEALRGHLEGVEAEDAFEAALVEAYLDGDVEFEALSDALGRRDAAAVRTSRALLAEGEEIARVLADALGGDG